MYLNKPTITIYCSLLSRQTPQFSTSFPSLMLCKLRVVKLGKSSVTYQVGIFEVSVDSASKSTQGKKAAVVTQSTHVFVDRV